MVEFEATLGDIYQTAVDVDHWPVAVESISATFGGRPTLMIADDTRSGELSLSASVGVDPDAWQIVGQHYSTLDTNPTLPLAMSVPIHRSVEQAGEIGEDVFRKSGLNQDVYVPQKQWPFLGTVAVRRADIFAGLSVMRSTTGTPPERRHHQIAERLSVHIGRALELAERFDARARAGTTFQAALDRMRDAIFLLSNAGELVYRNEAAERMLERGGSLVCRSGMLTASGTEDRRRLADAVVDAGRGREAGFLIDHADGSSLVVRVQRLWEGMTLGPGRILVTIHAAHRRARLDQQQAIALFGLTPAEARVACEVCATSGLENAARNLSISLNTVKSLLQRTYAKLDVRSQSEMAMLLASSLSTVSVW